MAVRACVCERACVSVLWNFVAWCVRVKVVRAVRESAVEMCGKTCVCVCVLCKIVTVV